VSHDHDHHDPGLAPETDQSPPVILTLVVLATLGLMAASIIAMIPIVNGQTQTLIYEKDLSVSSGELEALRVREDNQLLRSNTLEDGTKTISIAQAKAALAKNPALLTEAFGAPAAPEPVVVAEGMSEEDAALIATGQGLYASKTCIACHTLDGNRTVGPTFKGLWGSTHNLADGTSVTVDDAYFARSVKDPMSQITEGYPPAMPPLGLTDDEIAALAAYVKTLE
jgi:mono/diheme cytochrome c family protein